MNSISEKITAADIREEIIYKIIDSFIADNPSAISYLEDIFDKEERAVFRKILNLYREINENNYR